MLVSVAGVVFCEASACLFPLMFTDAVNRYRVLAVKLLTSRQVACRRTGCVMGWVVLIVVL